MTKICVSLAGVDAAALYEQAQQVGQAADVVEIRLDSMRRPEPEKCCSLLRQPLLFTNRPTREGGAFAGSEEERLAPLLEAVRLGAAYIDLEVRTDTSHRERLMEVMQGSPSKLILSWHDFHSTPSTEHLEAILEQMRDSGAYAGKIVTTAHRPEDVLRVMALQGQAAAFPLSCFCMGEAGRISRFATMYLGGFMTYTCLNAAQNTAPGQLCLPQLRDLIHIFSPNTLEQENATY